MSKMRMRCFCINVLRQGEENKKIHIKVRQEDIKLMGLVLSNSKVVVGFWEE